MYSYMYVYITPVSSISKSMIFPWHRPCTRRIKTLRGTKAFEAFAALTERQLRQRSAGPACSAVCQAMAET